MIELDEPVFTTLGACAAASINATILTNWLNREPHHPRR
jgi:hypothetical protein